MDPIYDSSSNQEDIKGKKKNKHKDDEFSSDGEEDQSFMQKLGGFLFFGCGNGKDNAPAKAKK
jgi:hypothetical protein